VIELRDVSYRYAGYANSVLHEISLRLADGEIVGLVGPNEGGKSTLCLVAAGLAPASIGGKVTGDVLIDGTSVTGLEPYQLAERVAVGFQNPNTQRSGIAATVFEEVALGPMNLGLEIGETVRRTKEALALLRLDDIRDRSPARLSGGQSQLVGIASLLAMQPRHVILDEPTAQLDPAGTALVGAALRALAARGTSLLIAEHKTDLLDEVCKRVVAIEQGRIVLDRPTEEAFADPRLVEIGVEPPSRVRLAAAVDAAGGDSSTIGRLLS
jgi:energy-coupling factor transport system ATP-binding protein